MVFPVVMYGCHLDQKESWAPKNSCFWTVVLKKILESLLDCKDIKPVNPKRDQPWICIESTGAEAAALMLWPPAKKPTLWKWPWCCGTLRAGGEGGDRGWVGCLASLIRWTWVWASSGSWWLTGKPGMLRSTESQRVRHNWATELEWKVYLSSTNEEKN